MPQAIIYQILNFYTPRQALDPGFRVLDNSANQRPDWYEYWPIRNFLLKESLDEQAFYGFLSPKFKQKSNLDAAQVEALVRDADASTDVISLTPSIHNSAYYLNVFEHGEAKHPGLLGVAQQFFQRLGKTTDLASLVTHRFQDRGIFELLRRAAALLAGVAQDQRGDLCHRGRSSRCAGRAIARAGTVSGAGQRADEDLCHRARRDLDPEYR
jgi:hypothetical protein